MFLTMLRRTASHQWTLRAESGPIGSSTEISLIDGLYGPIRDKVAQLKDPWKRGNTLYLRQSSMIGNADNLVAGIRSSWRRGPDRRNQRLRCRPQAVCRAVQASRRKSLSYCEAAVPA
jgi:hypothetical protein